jgi:hypothetical protein
MRVWAAIRRLGFQSAKRPRTLRMKCGWGCGAQLTGRNMRAHFTTCPKRPPDSSNPGSSHSHHRRRSPKVKTWPAAGTADALRLGLRCSAYRAQYACALHHMREAAASLRRRGATTGDLAQGGCPRGPRMECGWCRGTRLRRAGCGRISRYARSGRHRLWRVIDSALPAGQFSEYCDPGERHWSSADGRTAHYNCQT